MGYLRWLWWALRHPRKAWGPRCGAPPPRILADATTCIRWRGHEQHAHEGSEWHADGTGFIWNAERWQWMGPPIGPEERAVALWGEYREPLGGWGCGPYAGADVPLEG